jgi:Putative amidase domain
VLQPGTEPGLSSAPCYSAPNGGHTKGYYCSNLGNEVSWAHNHAYPGTNKDHNGFADDCTDFSSRSLAFGGGMPEDVAPSPAFQKHNDKYWYQYHALFGNTWTSQSWANSRDLGDFFNGQGGYFLKYVSSSKAGYIIFANWKGQKNKTGWGGVSHAGVITKVTSKNVYITQHTNNRYNEPLYGTAPTTWFGKNPALQVWIALPARKG